MSIKKLTVAAVAALGLSLGAYSASAGPLNEGAAFSSAKSPSTFTLVRSGMGGGGIGRRRHGPRWRRFWWWHGRRPYGRHGVWAATWAGCTSVAPG